MKSLNRFFSIIINFHFTDCCRKSARGTVTLYKPGTGKFTINGQQQIDYFSTTYTKETVSILNTCI